MTISVKFKKMSPTAMLPKEPELGNVGWDLYSDEDKILVSDVPTKISTNIQLADFVSCDKDGHKHKVYMKIEGRSGLSAKGIFPVGGIIDPAYRGEIGVVLTFVNRYNETYEIKKGDRIAQLVFYPYFDPTSVKISATDEVSSTERSDKGFGSSGR